LEKELQQKIIFMKFAQKSPLQNGPAQNGQRQKRSTTKRAAQSGRAKKTCFHL